MNQGDLDRLEGGRTGPVRRHRSAGNPGRVVAAESATRTKGYNLCPRPFERMDHAAYRRSPGDVRLRSQGSGAEITVRLSVMLSTQISKPDDASHPESLTMKASTIVAAPWQETAALQAIW